MIKKIIKIKPTVEELLIRSKACRDSDSYLILSVWAEQQPEIKDPNFLFKDFAEALMRDIFANAESIRRIRQKLQEENPHLRGDSYESRHASAVTMREEIINLI
jgi:hypothetical protein